MLIAILLNAVVIFLLYFPGLTIHPYLIKIDHIFILIFVLEALLKIRTFGFDRYFSAGWNRFDFIIVALTIPSLLVDYVAIPDTSIVIILRLFRLVRLIRFIRFVPNMSNIMAGLARALKASVFVLVAVFFLNFLLAIFSCQLYGNTAPEYFGDPLTAFFTIFQLFTIEGWNEIAVAVSSQVDHPFWLWLSRFYLGTIVLIGGIFGMSLVNAVFVDEMTLDNNQVLEQKIDDLQVQIAELKRILEEQGRSAGNP